MKRAKEVLKQAYNKIIEEFIEEFGGDAFPEVCYDSYDWV